MVVIVASCCLLLRVVVLARVRCLLFVVCLRVGARLFVDCCLMYVVRCYVLLFVAWRSVLVFRCLSCVVLCGLFVAEFCVVFVVGRMLWCL